MSEFEQLTIGKKYILEFIPRSNTGEKFVEMIPQKYQEGEYTQKLLVAKINPKCVAIINEYGCARVSKTIYLSMFNFKFEFNIFEENKSMP
jgi:hypothetical protein